MDNKTANVTTKTIIICPYCGTQNEIMDNYISTSDNTTGRIYCIKCGQLI